MVLRGSFVSGRIGGSLNPSNYTRKHTTSVHKQLGIFLFEDLEGYVNSKAPITNDPSKVWNLLEARGGRHHRISPVSLGAGGLLYRASSNDYEIDSACVINDGDSTYSRSQ